MGELGGISGKETIRRFLSLGYEVIRQRGSHVRLRATGRKMLTIPLHKELKIGLLHQLIKDSGISLDDFLHLGK